MRLLFIDRVVKIAIISIVLLGRYTRLLSTCHNEDGRIQLRKESLLQEVIHSEKLKWSSS